ncbi:hypothetical protein ACQR2L_01540 [Clostridium butyricum]|uniref:hypothetical protein n=1 Tax=Clostridium butyricum TaxID=1492 RepID=UPI00374EF439
MILNIYFHKDFDGVVAASLFSELMKKLNKYTDFKFIPVDYDIKDKWLSLDLNKPCAILDFLYHPDVEYYFDHHSTSFLGHSIERINKNKKKLRWDTSFKSTPSLIMDTFKDEFSFHGYEELIEWSDKIDSAQYDSPLELYDNSKIFIMLNKLIIHFRNIDDENKFIELIPFLIDLKIELFIEKYSDLLKELIKKEENLIFNLKDKITIRNDICIFDQYNSNIEYQRYLPYYFFSSLNYVIGIYNRGAGFSISIGYNPWKSNNKIDLGKIAEIYNGGGRTNVAGILVDSHENSLNIANSILLELEKLK